MGLLHLLGWPLRVARGAWAGISERGDTRLLTSLPVAGLDEAAAHQILFALRAAADKPDATSEDKELANQWLAALAIAQIVSDRLVADMRLVEASLDFWLERLRQGQHLRAMLFGQGPVSFAKDAYRLIARRKEQQRSATDKIEQRVIVLRGLRARLAEALAQTHAGAAQLHLRAVRSPPEAEAGAAPDPAALLAAARAAVRECLELTERARADVREHSRREVARLEAGHSQLRQAVLAQMLRARSLKAFSLAARPPPANGQHGSTEQAADAAVAAVARQGSEGGSALATLLARCERQLGLRLEVSRETSAHAALLQAGALAEAQPRLVSLPPWLEVPSRFRQQWIFYSALGTGLGCGAVWLFRHSRLAGSDDLDRWALGAVAAVRSAYREHMLRPLLAVRDELFQTFRQRRSIVSADDFEADKASLLRMLQDFRADNSSGSNSVADAAAGASLAESEDLRENLDFMMAHYERELKKPIRSLVTGRLPRTLLIQVQKLKVDTEAAMLQCDQILRANELSIALVAAIPALLIASLALVGAYRWLTPAPPDPRGEALPCRMAMVEVERAVQALTEGQSAEEQGLLAYRLSLVHEACVRLFRGRRRRLSGPAQQEWRSLSADLALLAAPRPAKQKAQTVKRMMRVYSIFKA